MGKTRNVAAVHFNTPELMEAAILSLRKHGGMNYQVYIFDNSDKRPFRKKMKGVKVFDNTKGKIIDFEKELEKYPERDVELGGALGCNFGSDKHMMSVQKLWELIPDGFLLMDSDILITDNVDFMFNYDECTVGTLTNSNGPNRYPRLAPQLLWINVPMCVAGGARFFDPDRAWSLHYSPSDKRNCWDTGGAFLDDIKRLKPQCHGLLTDIRNVMIHLGGGSWRANDVDKHKAWLEENCDLWEPGKPKKRYTVLTYIFNGYENVHEIKEKDPKAEYILVTDDKKLKSRTWKVVHDESLEGLSPFDKCYEVRFHPFRYANSDIVVRIDGSVEVKKSFKPIIDKFEEGGYDRCLMIHPRRNTMKPEYDVWIEHRNYPKEQAEKCLAFMKGVGYDLKSKGLYQGCFEVLRRNHANDALNDLTFATLKYLGDEEKIERLDQTITSFWANHLFSDKLKVMPVSEYLVTSSPFMQWYVHKSKSPLQTVGDVIPPMLFGKPCEPLW